MFARHIKTSVGAVIAISLCATWFMTLGGPAVGATPDDDDKAIAASLAAMLRSARAVISRNQDRINNPDIGDKGLTGKSVLAEAAKIYQENTNSDPMKADMTTR